MHVLMHSPSIDIDVLTVSGLTMQAAVPVQFAVCEFSLRHSVATLVLASYWLHVSLLAHIASLFMLHEPEAKLNPKAIKYAKVI